MKKMYLMKGMALLAMGLVAVSCNKMDFSGKPEVSKEEAFANAEMQLGITIDPNQDWKMTKEVKTTVGVKLGTGDDYTLLVYDKNPFAYDDAVYLAKQAVKDGNEVTLDITMPSGQTMVYLVALDSNKRSTVRRALVTDGAVNAVFTAEANAPALRRANTGEHHNATSDGINANANEWADPTPGKTFGGWVVPDPLTDEQKDVVKEYFQNVDNLTYEDPGFYHFFVQQVYKGGTDPGTLGNKEVNKGADGTTYGSSQLNKLTVGSANLHMNNFNSADCSSTNVLDKGYTANDFENHHHSDKIMLMVNIEDTGCMGYLNSGSSKQRNDKAGLVGWETIRDWANAKGLDGDCLEDGWNRSFVGFDFELLSLEDAYAKDNSGNQLYAPISAIPGNAPQYVWTGTEVQKIPAQSAPRRAKGRRAQVYGGGTFNITAGFQPSDGESAYIYNGDYKVGKVTFYGVASPAVADNTHSGFSAKLECDYIVYESLVTGQGNYYQLRVYHDTTNKVYLKDLTTDTDQSSFQDYNFEGYFGELNLAHSYKVYTKDNSKVVLYGVNTYVQGQTIEDGDSNNNGGNNNNNNNNENNNNNNNTQTQGDADLNSYVSSQYIVVNGTQIPYLDANMNQYGGIQKSLADGDMKITKDGRECLNLPKFKELIDDGYLPVEDKNLRTWVKWQGGDGYYSDWIVTLSEAKRIGDQEIIDTIVPPVRPSIWSYAFEDTDLGDYDLNDVVLKATEDDDNITLTLVAAGATLDLNIRLYDYDENGVNGYGSNYVTLQYNDFTEIHDMLNVDHGTMVNTGGNSANVNLLPTFTLSKSNYDAANLRLAIYSESQGEVRLSGSGDTPHGVLIPYDWSWPTERTHITRAYNNTSTSEDEADQSFSNFAQNAGHAEWWFKYPTGSVMKK